MNTYSPTAEIERQRRPGGRTAEVTQRINQAVLELLVEGGIDACTFQNVAAKAGVERSTLYRRNPDRWPTIMTAIIDFANRETPALASGSLRTDLYNVVSRLAGVLSGPLGPSLVAVAAAIQGGAAPGEGGRFWASRMEKLGPMFDSAVAHGELPADVDRDELFALAAGPVFFRKFIMSKLVDDAFVCMVVDHVCDHYCLKP